MVLVILSSRLLDVSFAVNDLPISSIISAAYPGQALAEIIFGDYNPSILSFHPFIVVFKHTILILYFNTISFPIIHMVRLLFFVISLV